MNIFIIQTIIYETSNHPRIQQVIALVKNMLIARAASAAARRGTLSHRGIAVAVSSQQFRDERGGEHSGSSTAHVGTLLVAAAAAAGLCPNILGDKSAGCCGIAGVVGGSGDAR